MTVNLDVTASDACHKTEHGRFQHTAGFCNHTSRRYVACAATHPRAGHHGLCETDGAVFVDGHVFLSHHRISLSGNRRTGKDTSRRTATERLTGRAGRNTLRDGQINRRLGRSFGKIVAKDRVAVHLRIVPCGNINGTHYVFGKNTAFGVERRHRFRADCHTSVV